MGRFLGVLAPLAGVKRGRETGAEGEIELITGATISSRAEPVPLGLSGRVSTIAYGTWNSQSGLAGNFTDSYDVAAAQLPAVLAELKSIESELAALEAQLEAEGAPWTPSRIPDWQP